MEEQSWWLGSWIDAFVAADWIEPVAVITGLLYVILAAQEKLACWYFGIVSSLLSIYLFYTGRLYAESILYTYYVFAGFYGWYVWSKRKVEKEQQSELQVHTWSLVQHTKAILLGIFFILPMSYVLDHFTDAELPWLDASTTVFSFIATYMVTRKVLSNWLYWIIIDLVTMGMYYYKEYILYAMLMAIYTIIAIVGYWRWKKRLSAVKLSV